MLIITAFGIHIVVSVYVGGVWCTLAKVHSFGVHRRAFSCTLAEYTIFSCRLADVAVHKTRILVYPHIVVYVYTKRANVHKLRTHIDESCVHVHIHIDESCVHVRTHIDASCVHVRTHIDELCIYTRPPPSVVYTPSSGSVRRVYIQRGGSLRCETYSICSD